ncbi:hypothetical protein OS493_026130, partial [Desmophyllum pertusum]
MKLCLIIFLAILFHGGIADFLVDQEAFFNSLTQLEMDRKEALSERLHDPLQEKEALLDGSAWSKVLLTKQKRSITSVKQNTIRLNLPDSLSKENATGR